MKNLILILAEGEQACIFRDPRESTCHTVFTDYF